MKILLLGKNGQLGWELQRALAPLGELVALDRRGAPGLTGDLADTEGLRRTVAEVRPRVIVNAAAYTAVDRAESEPAMARLINGQAPGALAHAAAACGALLVHYSTDYVFDGQGTRPWVEADAAAPLSVYGRSKLEGEQAIVQAGGLHLILRTSWVYGRRGGNFVRTMLRLAGEREELRVVDDQIGAPTGADLLADVSAHAIHQMLVRRPDAAVPPGGVYHVAAAGACSWRDYARHVLHRAQASGRALKAGPEQVLPIPSSGYPTPAQRPLNSRLDSTRFQESFGLVLPPWQQGVDRLLDDIL